MYSCSFWSKDSVVHPGLQHSTVKQDGFNTIHSKLKSVFWGTITLIFIKKFPISPFVINWKSINHPIIFWSPYNNGKYAFATQKQSNFELQLANTASSKLFWSVVFTVRSPTISLLNLACKSLKPEPLTAFEISLCNRTWKA